MNNLGSTQGYAGQSEQHDLDFFGDKVSCSPGFGSSFLHSCVLSLRMCPHAQFVEGWGRNQGLTHLGEHSVS